MHTLKVRGFILFPYFNFSVFAEARALRAALMGGIVPTGVEDATDKTAKLSPSKPLSSPMPKTAAEFRSQFVPRPPTITRSPPGPRSPAMRTPRIFSLEDSEELDTLKLPIAPAQQKPIVYSETMLLRNNFKKISTNSFVVRTGFKGNPEGHMPGYMEEAAESEEDDVVVAETLVTSQSIEMLVTCKGLQRSATRAVQEWLLIHLEGFTTAKKLGSKSLFQLAPAGF